MKMVDIKTIDGIIKVPINILDIDKKKYDYTEICNEYFGFFHTESKLKFKYIIRGGGYFTTTMQINIGIKLQKNMTLEQINDASEEILSIIQLIYPNKEGFKILSISEKTLGEYGVYELVISDKIIKIIKLVYGTPHEIFETNDIKKAIEEISKKYYYTDDYEEEE